jgi:hypothetical protein
VGPQRLRAYSSPIMQFVSAFGSGISVSVAAVSNSTLAMETAFSNASLTTLVRSMMPASIRSTYWHRAASNP